jgi:hypothetical protein
MVTDPTVLAVTEMFDVALSSYFMTPANEHMLTNTDEVQGVIRCLKFRKAPGRKFIPNRALKHLPQRAVSFLTHIFNSVLLTRTSLICGSTLG